MAISEQLRHRTWIVRPARWLALVLLVCVGPAVAQAQAPSSVAVVKLEARLEDQPRADVVTGILFELLNDFTKLQVQDRTDVSMSDLLLVYECDAETPECLSQVAGSFQTQQVLYGKVDLFGDDVLVILRVYDDVGRTLRPIYSRKIPQSELAAVLRADLTDLISGALWELPSYLSVTTPNVDVASVFVDGAPVGTAPLDRTKVQPGQRTIRVKAEGFEPWEQEVDFSAGTPVTLEVTLSPEQPMIVIIKDPNVVGPLGGGISVFPQGGQPDPAEPMEPIVEFTYRPPVTAWVLLGVGGLAMAGATATGIMTLSAQSDFENEDRQRRADELRQKTQGLAATTNVLFGVGGAALLTSGLMFAFFGDLVPAHTSGVQVGAAIDSGAGLVQLALPFD